MALSALAIALQGVLSISPLMLAVQALVESLAPILEVPQTSASGSMLAAQPTHRRRRTVSRPAWHHEEEEALLLSLLRH